MAKKAGAHSIHRLSRTGVERIKDKGVYTDGGGLYLQVAPTGAKSWLFRYMVDGRARSMGLGPLHSVDLDEARVAAVLLRQQRYRGLDPMEQREVQRAAEFDRTQAALGLQGATWEWCCENYVRDVKVPELSNPKHAAQWGSSLRTYTYPLLGARPVGSIKVVDVHAVLSSIWLTKNETASRVRGRMEAVFGWAKVRGYRKGDNPAAWKDSLVHLLAAPAKVQSTRPHPALPYARMPEFMAVLHGRHGTSALALEFLILTAQRTNPILTATWDEIDWANGVWESKAENMKMKHPHRTPLTAGALRVLAAARKIALGPHIFQNDGKPMSEPGMHVLIQKMHASHPWMVDPKQDNRRIVPHGFRSSFMDWAAEETQYPKEARDLALAHSIGDKTEAAYRRADMLEKRRPLMEDWARFVKG